MRKKSLVLGFVMLAMSSLAGCGSKVENKETVSPTTAASSAAAVIETEKRDGSYDLNNIKERNITLVERMGEQHIMGRTQAKFADALEELSGGKITSTRYLNGEIETGNNHIRDNMNAGIQDVGRMQLELLDYYGYKKGSVFGLPYLFRDRNHFWSFAESELGKSVLTDIENTDWSYVPLSYIEEGARHFFTTKEMKSYKDLAGRKIRVQTSDIYVALVESLGASATPMAWTEIYTALSTGVVDGAENPYAGYDSYILNEVAPYILEDGHIFAGGTLGVTEKLWNELNEEEKALFREAADIASQYNKEQCEADEVGIKEKLKAAGVTILEMEEAEKEELQGLVKPLYERFAGDYKSVIEEIQNIK